MVKLTNIIIILSLLQSSSFFEVVNSNRSDFYVNTQPQNMSSGLYSSYINDGNPDYNKIKAKGGLLIDFDLDGDLDLAYGYSESYYFRNQNGVFEDITQSYLIDNQGSRGFVCGDIDNNGYPDILKWRFKDYDAIDSLLYFDTASPFRSMSHHLLMNQGSHEFHTINYLDDSKLPFLHSQGLIDYDLDGDLDIVAIEKEGDEQFYVFRNNGFNQNGDIILEQVFSYIQLDGSTSRTLAIADYDNDGDQDIYIPRKYGKNWLFENQTLQGSYDNVVYNSNPDNLFIEVAEQNNIHDDSFQGLGSMGYGAAWGDYDNDNDLDLYLSNWGINRLFQNELQVFTDVSSYYDVFSDSLSNGAAWGDYDNDGWLDLWAGNIRIRDDLFYGGVLDDWNNNISPEYLSATQDVVAGDYNGDGWLDSFVPGLQMINPPFGPKYTSLLYKNNTQDSISSNNWIKINLEGAKNSTISEGWSDKSNKSAIGARVILNMPDGSIKSREIIAGKGHGSMDALELHFGIGTFNYIESIIIRWPSKDLDTNQQKIELYQGPISINKSYKIVEDLGFVGKKGDFNIDEEVNILDVMALINQVLYDGNIDREVFWAGDLNFSDELNILDITKLVYFVLFH